MPIVTPDEVSILVQRQFSAAEEEAVNLVLRMMEGELELLCNRPLAPRTFTEITKVVEGEAFLSKTPVASVTTVAHVPDGTLIEPSKYSVRSWGLLMAAEDPSTSGAWAPTPVPLDLDRLGWEIKVTYTGGLPSADWRYQGARSLLLSRTARIANKVHDDAVGTDSVNQEGYSAKYMEEGWTDQELARANRLKRRTLVK